MKMNETNLMLALANKCWSITDLSYKAKISKGTIYDLLKGRRPSPKTIGKIAKALEVKPIDIVRIDD